MCSTPIGITGSDTRRLGSWGVKKVCAQRLSASQVATLDALVSPSLNWVLCSTPIGITGSDTLAGGVPRSAAEVLNAYRHHR